MTAALEAAAPEGAEVRRPASVLRGPYMQHVTLTGRSTCRAAAPQAALACLPASTTTSTLLARRGSASEESAEPESHALWPRASATAEVSACSAPAAHAISPGWLQAWGAGLAASIEPLGRLPSHAPGRAGARRVVPLAAATAGRRGGGAVTPPRAMQQAGVEVRRMQ